MSGGTYDFIQDDMEETADNLANDIANRKDLPPIARAYLLHTVDGLRYLAILVRRADWLMSDDDGPYDYLRRITEDMQKAGIGIPDIGDKLQ